MGGGGGEAAAPPLALAIDALERLRRERVVAVDGALPPELLARAAAEVSAGVHARREGRARRVLALRPPTRPPHDRRARSQVRVLARSGVLACDAEDTCNPLQQQHHLQLWHPDILHKLQTVVPGLASAVRAVWSLPAQLAAALDLQLRVPQTMMLARYPAGAHYHRHLDSYRGEDIPRLLTVLLYLVWAPAQGGELRVHLPSGPRDYAPRPGRLVVFFSQEVEHEVLPSQGERVALTQWLWDVKRDSLGR